ncbi:DHH family phosphoesterase [Pseudalkalibacillus caeni]|uniref:Oligoribonuclease n=1 Tax=Exobacillus caeni TaxID=2574798 RepID=A0A5R9F0T5_9BACL|nr:DHHA1 domain-containing protein [Pseudalkalibacillus caeni]TLS35048.1 oligoribonuclease [Pseudalkalibacillus caeni]
MYRLYSHNDLDGVGCGIIAKIAFGPEVLVRYNSIGGLNYQIERFFERNHKDDYLFISDLSVNEENEKRIEDFVKSGGEAKLIDHHKTALHFNKYEWGEVTVEYEDGRLACATSLLYGYLKENNKIEPTRTLDEFVELVRQYDTWEWEMNDNNEAKRLNDLFFMISIEEFEERMVERILSRESFTLDDFEEKILDMEENKIERYLRKKKREMVQTFIDGHCVGIVHAESYHSELGNELGKTCPHLDYIAIINVGGKKISLRTIHNNIDVSEVANQFGGGGHAKASGCPLTEDAYHLFLADVFHLEPMRPDAFKNIYNLKESNRGVLYENREEEKFFIFPITDEEWIIEWDGLHINESFSYFVDAERYVKRNHSAWLVRDEGYVEFLMENVMTMKKKMYSWEETAEMNDKTFAYPSKDDHEDGKTLYR